MAQFRATVQGRRGEISRLGDRRSGITAKINGWHSGIYVKASVENGADCFEVYQTGGSGATVCVPIGRLINGEFIPSQATVDMFHVVERRMAVGL